METTFQYLRKFGPLLAERILETYPPLQSTKDPVAPRIATLLRKALPAQALAITGTAKYLRRAKAARIVAECGAGKTYMALGTIHVLANERPSTTLVMCPSHITHKWAREVLMTIPRARAFLIEDMRNGGDPTRPHGISLLPRKCPLQTPVRSHPSLPLRACQVMQLSLMVRFPQLSRPADSRSHSRPAPLRLHRRMR